MSKRLQYDDKIPSNELQPRKLSSKHSLRRKCHWRYMARNKKRAAPASKFDSQFETPQNKYAFKVTVLIAVFVAVYFLFDINKFVLLFYDPSASNMRNFVSFIGLLTSCFVFGFVTSKVIAFLKR